MAGAAGDASTSHAGAGRAKPDVSKGALARFFPEFVAGMAAARLAGLVERRPERAWRSRLAGGVLLAGACARCHAGDWAVVGRDLGSCSAGLLIAARQGRAAALARIPADAADSLGDLSFAFYMSFALVETGQALGLARALGTRAGRKAAGLSVVETTALTFGAGDSARMVLRRAPGVAARAAIWRRARPGV